LHAKNTKTSTKTALNSWNRFCRETGAKERIEFEGGREEEQTKWICLWLQYEKERVHGPGKMMGKKCINSFTSFTVYLAGLQRDVANRGLKWNPTWKLERKLRVLRNEYSSGEKRKLPLLMPMVRKLLDDRIINRHEGKGLETACIMLLSIYGLMRISEVLQLEVNDINTQPSGDMEVTIRHYKNQAAFGGLAAHIPIAKTMRHCPVEMINIVMRGKKNSDRIFTLTRDQYSYRLKKALARIGFNDMKYDTHSGRIGGVTMLWNNGVQDSVIQKLGRWTSDCWKVYIRLGKEHCKKMLKIIESSMMKSRDVISRTKCIIRVDTKKLR